MRRSAEKEEVKYDVDVVVITARRRRRSFRARRRRRCCNLTFFEPSLLCFDYTELI